MATHIFVNPDMTPNVSGDIAQAHISSDPPTGVTVTLFPSGKHESLQMNGNGFAISSDLFQMAGGKPQLVVVTTTDPRQPSTMILRQRLGDSRLATVIPSEDKAAGTAFTFPLEFLADGAQLLIANAGPADAVGVFQYGTPRAAVASEVHVPRNGFQTIKLTKSTTAGLLTITNAVNVVAHLVLDTSGNDFDLMTILPVSRA
jgi:hypothetical protein